MIGQWLRWLTRLGLLRSRAYDLPAQAITSHWWKSKRRQPDSPERRQPDHGPPQP